MGSLSRGYIKVIPIGGSLDGIYQALFAASGKVPISDSPPEMVLGPAVELLCNYFPAKNTLRVQMPIYEVPIQNHDGS